ncbi:MAG TPA: peptidase M16 [Prevotella sp.]|nr:peptidase M16 [Prevotella sp.]
MEYNTITLSNGLRVIHLQSPSPVVYCGYEVCAGTRDEQTGEEGLAHFCEHVTFKGTSRRSSIQVLNCLESVGGELNAYTNKEETVFYAAILKEHFPKAVDLLSDIVFNSTYPQNEINKEVEVICDEIESYNDSPAELIYDDFENAIFVGHPLGHNILGCEKLLRGFTTDDALRFTRRFYKPENAVFFVSGDVDFNKVVKLLKKATATFPAAKPLVDVAPKVSLPKYESRLFVNDKGTHQAHVMIGNRAYSVHDKRRMPLYLLNNILGGPGMNARLNLSLRERHALVYTVESTMVCYSDTGLWCVYFGCDPKDINKCIKLVRRELDKIIEKPLSEGQLKAAKRQIKGQIGVACDNRESFALDFGKTFLHYGWKKDITKLMDDIERITAEDIQLVAQDIMTSGHLTSLVYE